jgi:preprotein translocase subunit SecD
VQDIVDLLNAGSLPAAIRKVEQRMVDVAQQPSP